MTKLILHIPHASDVIPLKKGYVADKKTLNNELVKLTDWYTDDLFLIEESIIVKAEFSRVFCDTERFADDSQEIMAKVGMGVLYEKLDNGSPLREVGPLLREEILSKYYWPHHEKLSHAVYEELMTNGSALIVDCHSFPSRPLIRDLCQDNDRPDFNIGTDTFHTPDFLIQESVNFFKDKGYTLGINWPYSGSIVPLTHYRKNKSVYTIMLEVNRSLYLSEPSNQKSVNYPLIKEIVTQYLQMLKHTMIRR
jgi:N-formylglutamate amidohydrolase